MKYKYRLVIAIMILVGISCEDSSTIEYRKSEELQLVQASSENISSNVSETTKNSEPSNDEVPEALFGGLRESMLNDEEQIIALVESYLDNRMQATNSQSGWEFYHPDIAFLYDRHFTYVVLHPRYEISFEVVYDNINLMEPQEEYLAKVVTVFEKALLIDLSDSAERLENDRITEIERYALTFYVSKSAGDYRILALSPLNDGEKYSIESLRTVSEKIRESNIRVADKLLLLLVQIEEERFLE